MRCLIIVVLLIPVMGCSSQPEKQGTYIGNRGGKDIHEDDNKPAADITTEEDIGRVEDAASPDGVAPEDAAELDSAEPVDVGTWSEQYGASCPLDEKVGGIKVYHEVAYGVTTGYVVAGEIENGIRSGAIRIPGQEEGFCRIMELINPFCQPPCADLSEEQCMPDGNCAPYPVTVSGGLLTLTGLSEDIQVTPDTGTKYSKWGFAGELFSMGKQIEMTLAGDELAGLSMQGHGVELLELTTMPVNITEDESLNIEWVPSAGPGTMFLMVSIGNHADSPSSIWCELPEDSGELQIDSGLVNTLLKDWKAGTITASLFRQTVDSASTKFGCVEFRVYSDVTWDPTVPETENE